MQTAVSKPAKVLPVEADIFASLWEAYWNDDLRAIANLTGHMDSAYLKTHKLQDSKRDPERRVPVESRSHYDE